MTQQDITTKSITDVASACIKKIQTSRHAKAVFLFSETDYLVVGVDTKKYNQMRKNHPDNFLGIYDSRVTVDWLDEDVRHMFRNQAM